MKSQFGCSVFRRLALLAALFIFSIPSCNKSTSSGKSASDVLAKIDGNPIHAKDLSNRHRMELYQAEMEYYRSQQEALDKMINDRLIEEEAKKAGITSEALRKREIEEKVPNATDAEIDEFFKANKARIDDRIKSIPKGQPKPAMADLKKMIGQQITQRRYQERMQAYMSELRNAHKVEVLVKAPEAPRVEVSAGNNNPSMGSDNAKVTIITFSDFQCPFCARAVPTLKEIEKNYGDKVKVVFRDFPLSFHNTARHQAEAAACANDQGKFWEYHDKLFASQDKLATAFGGGSEAALKQSLVAFAKDLGMKPDEFGKCLDEHKHAQNIEEDIRAAEDAGVNSTPSFFVNGRLLAGALPFPEFKKIIDEEMAK